MQLITSLNRKIFVITIFLLISITVNMSLEKSLNELNKNQNSFSLERTENQRKKIHSKSTSQSKSKMKQGAPYDPQNTIQLVKEIGNIVLPQDEKTPQVFGSCLKFIVDQPDSFSSQLSSFWTKMGSIASKASQWDSNSFNSIISAVGSKNVLYNQQSTSCGSLQITGNVDSSKIMNILNQGNYFGGFNKTTQYKKQFIEGMVSHHRDSIDSNTFEIINKVSRGEDVNSSGNSPSGKTSGTPPVTPKPSGSSLPLPSGSGLTPPGSSTTPSGSGLTPPGSSTTPSGSNVTPSGSTVTPSGSDVPPARSTSHPKSGSKPEDKNYKLKEELKHIREYYNKF